MAEEESWETPRGWSSCPLDVLIQIFEELDGESLVNCLRVNSWWRDIVDYYAEHYSRWREIAEAGMLNNGRKLRDKSFSETSWRDLFFNYHLWNHVESAQITWGYFKEDEEIQKLHVFKDTLLVGHGEKESNIGGEMYKELRMVEHRIKDILPVALPTCTIKEKCKSSKLKNSFNADMLQHEEERANRMKEKLLEECPFTKYTVYDDNSFYILDEANVMRRFAWEYMNDKWSDEVLGRYYGCSRSIKDIHVSDSDVYILLKTGTVMKTDKTGRNFENSAFLDLPAHSLTLFMRLLGSPVLLTLETAYNLKMSLFTTNPNILFNKFSAVVGVPYGNKYNIRRQKDVDQVVLECPDLSYALEHGEMLILGYHDGRVDICNMKDLLVAYKPKLTFNFLDCPICQDTFTDPTIVGIEVFESKESHHIFIATRFNVFTVSLTYPDTVKDSINVIKRCAT